MKKDVANNDRKVIFVYLFLQGLHDIHTLTMQPLISSNINKLVFLSLLVLMNSCNQDNESNNISNIADSQVEINLSSEQRYISTKRELDSLYNSVLTEYTSNAEMTKNIKNSQETWILYRDAQLLMKYPETDPLREGSAFNTCYFSYLTELTMERLETLKPWLNGAKEGDVCSGSINIK